MYCISHATQVGVFFVLCGQVSKDFKTKTFVEDVILILVVVKGQLLQEAAVCGTVKDARLLMLVEHRSTVGMLVCYLFSITCLASEKINVLYNTTTIRHLVLRKTRGCPSPCSSILEALLNSSCFNPALE